LLGTMVLTGCPYSLNPRGSVTIKSVAVERFQNDTPEFGLADQMTDAIINAFIADGTMKVLPKDHAEAVLSGTLTRYDRRPYEYDENDQVKSYIVEMDFDITLRKVTNDSLLWQEKMNQRGAYDLAAETEEVGRQRALEFLVQAIINRTTKSW
ncbi:MAG: LPS assembly lipoprotein LptE, partial [Candidatus Zixiibacteriota bacterium]